VAGSFLSSAEVSGIINPFSLTLLRLAIAFLALLPIVLAGKHRNQIISVLPRGMLISLFYTGYFVCFFESLKTTTALNTGTLFTLMPFITALLCIPLFRQKIGTLQLAAYLLGAAATTWVIFQGDLDRLLAFTLNKGDLIFMAGILAMAGYSISMKLMYRNTDMGVLVMCSLAGGCFWMTLVMVFFKLPLQWGLLTGPPMWHMAYLAIGATLGTSYLFQKAVVALGPVRVAAYSYLNPAGVAILLLLFKGAAIPGAVIPGIVLSAISTLILQIPGKSPSKTRLS
jgi:drug/metabolite transporter (DMT)-like permease